MARFGFQPAEADDGGNIFGSPPPAASSRAKRRPTGGAPLHSTSIFSSPPTTNDGSSSPLLPCVRLCCASPDGKQWHSIIRRPQQPSMRGGGQSQFVLSSRRLEEQGEDLVDVEPSPLPSRLEIVLPESVQDILAIDPPLDLLCVEPEGTELIRLKLRPNDRRLGLPRLVLYSSKSVFMLQGAFDPSRYSSNRDEDTAVMGEVAWVREPLEEYLLNAGSSTRILRIRPAPQRWMGHALHSPGGCFAMLTEDSASQEFHVTCLESTGSPGTSSLSTSVKEPVFKFGLEQVLASQERVVDFCFAQSTGLSLFSSMSLLLLKASGDVLAASPFVFDGALVTRDALDEAVDFLQTTINGLDRSEPKWRQCRAAQQCLVDIFPTTSDRRTRFVAAKTLARSRGRQTAAAWPVKLQGPILFRSDSEGNGECDCLAIEPYGNADLIGFATCAQGGRIDVGVTSPTSILPRFACESRNDAFRLDDDNFRCSAWVDRVNLGLESTSSNAVSASMDLYRDPNMDTILHVVSPALVASISSDCVKQAALQVRMGQGARTAGGTAAWSCLEQTANRSSIQGVVASTDNIDGHKILIQLANGVVETINVAKEKAAHEMKMLQASKPALALLEAGDSFQQGRMEKGVSAVIDSTPLFSETAAAQVEKVNKGLASMGKIVGSETRHDQITPEMLAVIASIQQRCEKEVVLPVLELAKMIQSRRQAVRTMIQQQSAQLARLMETRAELEAGNERIRISLAAVEDNAHLLKERTQRAQATLHSLDLTVTPAERAYFGFVEQSSVKVNKWERETRALQGQVHEQCVSASGKLVKSSSELLKGGVAVADLQNLNADVRRRLMNSRQYLKQTEQRLTAALHKAGLEPSEHVTGSSIQHV